MPLENCLYATEAIIDFDNFASERIKASFKTRKPILDARESCVHIRFQTSKTGIQRVVLEHPANHVHDDGKDRHSDSEVKLRVIHDCFIIAAEHGRRWGSRTPRFTRFYYVCPFQYAEIRANWTREVKPHDEIIQ